MGAGPSGHGMNMDDIFSNFGDIFGDIFGGDTRRRRTRTGPTPQRGHDLYKELNITLKESFLGTKKDISYYHFAPCETCKGTGTAPGTQPQTCAKCQGGGNIQFRQGFFMYSQPCGACEGHGYIIASPCTSCRGQSRKQLYDKFVITIPAGVFDGSELRKAAKGDAGVYEGGSGDLLIRLQITPDKRFKRVGDDLVCAVMLTYPQLVLGGKIEIENIDGTKETIKIPRGCPVGERIIIPGKGFPKLRNKAHGNLVVITQCHIPKKLSAEAKKLLGQYAKQIGNSVDNIGDTISNFFRSFLG